MPPSLVAKWLKCPMRGRRLPELATSYFDEVVATLFDRSLVELAAELPPDISAENRNALNVEYCRGRSHLAFGFSLKYHAMHYAPRLLFGIAHAHEG